MKHCFLNPFRSQLLGLFFSINSLIIFYEKEFTLRLDDAACAELENLKKLSGEKQMLKLLDLLFRIMQL